MNSIANHDDSSLKMAADSSLPTSSHGFFSSSNFSNVLKEVDMFVCFFATEEYRL